MKIYIYVPINLLSEFYLSMKGEDSRKTKMRFHSFDLRISNIGILAIFFSLIIEL
jgi:hypothetical protein